MRRLILWLGLVLGVAQAAFAHCDTMSGPVVSAAQEALQTGNVNYVLIWVKPENEERIRAEFAQALKDPADEQARMRFFEVLVKAHREGEGEEFTGIEPAGSEDPLAKSADGAIATGDVGPLLELIKLEGRDTVKEGFDKVMALKNYDVNDVAAGREYVEAYVTLLHHAEEAAK